MNKHKAKIWKAREPRAHTLGPLDEPVQPQAAIEVSGSDFDPETS